MVRKEQLASTGTVTKEISAYVSNKLESNGQTAQDVANVLNRSYNYAYLRVQGLKSFTIDELEKIAYMLGCHSVFELISAVREQMIERLMNNAGNNKN